MSKLRMEDKNILESYSDIRVGEVFMKARTARGITLEEAATRTLINREVLKAIEAHDVANLPDRVYMLGFLKTYADFLELDSPKMSYLYKVQVIGDDEPEEDQEKQKRPSKKRLKTKKTRDGNGPLSGAGAEILSLMIDSPRIFLVVFVFNAVGLGLIIGSYIFVSAQIYKGVTRPNIQVAEPIPTPRLERANPVVEDALDDGSMIPDPNTALWPAIEDKTKLLGASILPEGNGQAYGDIEHKNGVALFLKGQSWINIKEDNDEQAMRVNTVLNAGDVLYLDPRATFILKTTHADAIEVFMHGEFLGTFSGAEGQEKQFTINQSSLDAIFGNE